MRCLINDFLKQLDDWVLCRIYNKKGAIEKNRPTPSQTTASAMEADDYEDRKPENLRGLTTASLHAPATATATASGAAAGTNDFMHFGPADSVPRLHTDSSCSEQVVSPEFTSEVQSEPKWKSEWDSVFDFGGGSYLDAVDFRGSQVSGVMSQMSPLQDMFVNIQKPF